MKWWISKSIIKLKKGVKQWRNFAITLSELSIGKEKGSIIPIQHNQRRDPEHFMNGVLAYGQTLKYSWFYILLHETAHCTSLIIL